MRAPVPLPSAFLPKLAVAICTHNPRPFLLQEAIEALRQQSLAAREWDLLIIDNASIEPIHNWLDLSWHPRAHIEREEKLGTAHARHHALNSLRDYELLLFVDDDNILDGNYLEEGLRIANRFPRLGCWGGQLIPRFEAPPPGWLSAYHKYLAIWEFSQASVTSSISSYDVCPPSAGCFIRERVRVCYLELVEKNSRRLTLGAKGDLQIRGEDLDLVLTALDLGLELGRFPELRLLHHVPQSRMEPRYVANLLEGTALGTLLLEYLRHARKPVVSRFTLANRLLTTWRKWRLPAPIGEFYAAELRGVRNAIKIIHQWESHCQSHLE